MSDMIAPDTMSTSQGLGPRANQKQNEFTIAQDQLQKMIKNKMDECVPTYAILQFKEVENKGEEHRRENLK
jgi:hypothetical protein